MGLFGRLAGDGVKRSASDARARLKSLTLSRASRERPLPGSLPRESRQ